MRWPLRVGSDSLGPQRQGNGSLTLLLWRKRVGVEPTGDRKTCRPPVLKTGRITGPHALPCRCRPGLLFHVSWRAGSMPRTMGILQYRQSVPRGTFCTAVYVLILTYIYIS